MTGIGKVQRVEVAGLGEFVPQDRREFSDDSAATPVTSPNEEKGKFDFSTLSDDQKKKLEENLKKVNDSLASSGKMLKFKYDEEAKTTYVEVIDTESQKVVASLPPEFLIDLSVRMKELIGMFIDKRL